MKERDWQPLSEAVPSVTSEETKNPPLLCNQLADSTDLMCTRYGNVVIECEN